MYFNTFGEDATGLVFISGLVRTERQSDNSIWYFYNVYRDGVHEVLPFDDTVARGFYNMVQRSTGVHASRDQLTTYNGEITALGAQPRLWMGPVASATNALTGNPAIQGHILNAQSNLHVLELRTTHPASGNLVNITKATVIDLRPPENRSAVLPGYAITPSGQGITTALRDETRSEHGNAEQKHMNGDVVLHIAVLYPNNTRLASVVYIFGDNIVPTNP